MNKVPAAFVYTTTTIDMLSWAQPRLYTVGENEDGHEAVLLMMYFARSFMDESTHLIIFCLLLLHILYSMPLFLFSFPDTFA